MSIPMDLPNELWQRIFAFASYENRDKPALWLEGRRVSKQWKANIEQTYRDLYLKDPRLFSLTIDCGMTRIPDFETGIKTFMSVTMVFDRAASGSNGQRCVFAEPSSPVKKGFWEKEQYEAVYQKRKWSAWRERIMFYQGGDEGARAEGGRFDVPPWVIELHKKPTMLLDDSEAEEEDEDEDAEDAEDAEQHIINDTELPDVTIDMDKHEISFNWVQMFSKLFAEEAEMAKRGGSIEQKVKEIVRSHLGVSTENGPQADASRAAAMMDLLSSSSGSVAALEDFVKALKGVQSGETLNRKQIRRERIKRFYREKAGFEHSDELFGADEKECLRKLMPMEALGTSPGMFGFDGEEDSEGEEMNAFDFLGSRMGLDDEWDDEDEWEETDDDQDGP